jgi:hypothetical protein
MTGAEPLGGSFRDPSGFVFRRDGLLYRQINAAYGPAYDHLTASGLLARLVAEERLVATEDADPRLGAGDEVYKVLRLEPLPFVSYPYEWCPGQLRDAALLTLAVHRAALDHGMVLKDASAYNVQFLGSRPVFIDHLSFDLYEEGAPWVGYRQFCQHFLAPLALAVLVDVRLGGLLRTHLDGIPLDLASRLLPRRTWLRFSLLAHLHLHARSQARFRARPAPIAGRRITPAQLRGIVASLEAAVRRLRWRPPRSEWTAYHAETSYTPEAAAAKQRIVTGFLDRAKPRSVWDLGGNVGLVSRLASERGVPTVCFDRDAAAVEAAYLRGRTARERFLLPVWLDLTNPSPALGWAHAERDSLAQRGPVDLVMALALLHHLAIAQNVPLDRLAGYLAALGAWLILEFVPKADPQVQRLLATRPDIFPSYDPASCERAFGRHFEIVEREPIPASLRTLYLMRARSR